MTTNFTSDHGEFRELRFDELDVVSGAGKSKAGGTSTIIDIGPLRITGGDGTFGIGIFGGPGIILDFNDGSVCAGLGGKGNGCID